MEHSPCNVEPPRGATPSRPWACGLAALGLLCAGAAAHFWYLTHNCPLDLSGDEAHYWEWSRRLDLCYYSKGPLVAYIIALGRLVLGEWSQRVVGNEALAVRVPAMLLSIGTGLGIYTLAVQALKSARIALAAVALTCTIPILAVGAILMTIDAPLAFLYVWTLVLCQRGLRCDSTWPWLAAGVLIGLGVLAKYNMLLIFPTVGLVILTEPTCRAKLRRPGPYLATVIGLLGLVPILAWNAQHNWVSFRHVAGQAGVADKTSFNPAGIVEFFAGQAAVVGPVWFVAMLLAVVALWRQPRPQPGEHHSPAALRLLLYATLVPWAVFLVFSPITKIQPNWPMLSLLPGVILLALWLARLLRQTNRQTRRRATALVAVGTILGVATVVVMHRTEWLMPLLARVAPKESVFNLTPVAKYDPTARLRGWSQLGAAVGRHLDAAHRGGRDPFIVTDDYQVASEIAFYCPGRPQVYCLQAALGNRQSQYDIWPNPIRDAGEFVGRPCIYVGSRKPELFGEGRFAPAALRGAQLVETVEHRVRGHLIQLWPVYTCEEFAGLASELRQRASVKF